jgi:drug/metabolite transporter (DMT)-like permease
MDIPSNFLGIFFALTSAFVWGAGDFSGGMASRRSHSIQVLALSSLSGLLVLAGCAFLWREALPSLPGILWSVGAGFSGAVGIALLYGALSMGYAAVVAPTSAVISALLPVIFSIWTDGLPAPARLFGFILALAGIWLVSQQADGKLEGVSRKAFSMACLAGVAFGGFFILVAQVEHGEVFTPLVICRFVALLTSLLLLAVNRLPMPGLRSNPVALLAGVLDVGGNTFYLLAKQYTSLDVAAVLASLYPASTVLLARIILKEKIAALQWFGIVLCLVAISLITF